MHNNFYFLRQISASLASILEGAVISECFSQQKDELIIRFEMKTDIFFIKASLLPDLSCLSFPEDFQRARRNSVDLFPAIVGRRVLGIRQYTNERSFALLLSDNHQLLFKMHGNRTNLVLFTDGIGVELFRKNLAADLNLTPDDADRDIDWSYDYFQSNVHNLKPAYFTFGKVVWRYLEEQDFFALPVTSQWEALRAMLVLLEEPTYYITQIDHKPTLSLLKTGDVQQEFTHALEAANAYYHTFTHLYAFVKEKTSLLSTLKTQLAAGQNYCTKNTARIAEIRNDEHYRQWADLIMANLHSISSGSQNITVNNFYDEGRPITISLNKDLSPQKNAEIFYRKAKNQHLEVERLERAIGQKFEELEMLSKQIDAVEAINDLKALRSLRSATDTADTRKATSSLPYHEFQFKAYRIWVGKNAQSNDKLTLKYSYKEDLWLHAKDVSGSHVLIKYQSGKKFPKDVIEYAASLAAYNSKRKNESLCPVVVTPKKFVRKRKGDPPGAVVIERESVVIVPPLAG